MPSLNLVNQTFAAPSAAADSYALLLGTQEPASVVTDYHIDEIGRANV